MAKDNQAHQGLSAEFIADRESYKLVPLEQMKNGINLAIKAAGGTVPIIKTDAGFNEKRQVISYYKIAYSAWESYKPTEEKIFRIEEKGHNLKFKYHIKTSIVTALIMFILYGAAHYFGFKLLL